MQRPASQQQTLPFDPVPPHTTAPASASVATGTSPSIANRNQVYHQVTEMHRSTVRAAIIDHLRSTGPCTREEVAIALGKEVHQISGRFTALLSAGTIEETNEKRPTRTGHLAVVVRLKPDA